MIECFHKNCVLEMFCKVKLESVIIDIEKLNDLDSIDVLEKNTGITVFKTLKSFLDSRENCSSGHKNTFMITDNRRAADFAIENEIGIAVYINDINSASDFSEALYCVDSLKEMTKNTLIRMYERANDIPWTIMETKRCIVSEMTLDDVDRLYEIYADKETKQYVEDLYKDREEEREYTKKYINNQYKFFEYGIWIVREKEDSVIIGRAGLFNRDDQDEIEIGFVFAREYWGMGYASEVLSAILSYAREELDVTNIVAHVHHENDRSKKLLMKLGFEFVKETEIDNKAYDRYHKEL